MVGRIRQKRHSPLRGQTRASTIDLSAVGARGDCGDHRSKSKMVVLSGAFWARPVRACKLLASHELLEEDGKTLGHRLRKSVQFKSNAIYSDDFLVASGDRGEQPLAH